MKIAIEVIHTMDWMNSGVLYTSFNGEEGKWLGHMTAIEYID